MDTRFAITEYPNAAALTAQLDALIADVYIGAGYQTAYLILRFVAEAAPMQPARGEFILGHGSPQAFFLRG